MRTTFILRSTVCCLLTAIVVSSFAKHPASGENLNAEDIFNHFIGENAIAAVMPSEPCTTGAVSYCYGNNETTEITYCSGDPDVEVAFVTLLDYSFQSCCDKIEFYQGTGTSGTLLGSITGNGTSGYSYIGEYTANGGDGCVTVVITSDGSGSCADGGSTPTTWEVGCQTICYPPTAVLDVSTEEICSTEADNQDNSQTVVFSASNSIHNQGSSFTSYEWDFGDGSSVTTATPVVSHSYSNSGGYITSLVVTDDLGCESTALEEVLLKLSGTPTFDLSNDADPLGVCPGTEVTLNPNVTPYSWSEPEIQPDPDPTPLPDGTGSSYSSAVIFNQFGENDVISDGTNMTIMLNFEHSYVGDLDIDLVSPDGTRLNLLNFFTNGMGNCNVGGAGEYSGGEGPPGAGDEYYFNINAGTDFSSFSGPGSTSAVGVDIPSGTYAPDDSFAGFNGSPINGVWEIFITDNYNLDDGTLFTWSIDLGPIDAAKISLEEFETTQQSAVWSGENVVGNTAAPTTSGTATYTLTYTDNFGCVHTEETSFTVLPADDASCVEPDVSINSINADNFFCPNNTVWLNIENNGDLVTPSNMPITIYDGDPTQAGTEILSTIYTTEQIAVGASIDVEFDLALTENLNAHVVLNDDGSLSPPISYTDDFPTTAINESNYSNNSATVDLSCPDNDEDGIFDSIDLDDDNDGITDCEERGLANVAVNSLFTLSGDATAISDNEVRLTEAANNQAGQFWGNNKMDFTYSFDFEFSINLGNSNSGADGIAVVFHNDPDGTSASGATGGGIGAQGIEDGLMLEFDTYFNGTPNDISNDHGSILDTDGGTAPLSAIQDLGDIEDGQWHEVKVTWDAENFILAYYLDDILAGSLNADVVDNYFGGREQVYFGYTASTGGAINDQRIRFGETCDFPFIVDTDGDGIVNELDLDSDNDGIYDAVEAGHNENHTNGIVNGNVGEDGIPDAVQASGDEDAGTVDYLTADSDDDDNFDAYEIDSDGDGCYDSREAGFTDSNHDGILGGEIVNTNDDGLITSGSDGYTDPGTNYTNNQVGYCLPEICDDGIDNDNDGDTDCLDSDCSEFADCNLPPIADDETAEVDEDSSVAINVLDGDSDPEGNLASLPTIDSQPANGTVEINGDGTITYTPNDDFNGSDSFTYEICDTFASPLCDQATVNITVNPINDEPIANDDDATTDEDTAVTVDVLDNDSDIDGNLGDPEITSGPSNGTVEINDDGTITYTPEDDFNGEDSFTYEVCDDGTPMPAECDEATVYHYS